MGALTRRRAKPALPFAGLYRLVDFPLSNCTNSGITDVWVVQQYEPHSLESHLANGRPWDLDRTEGGLRILHPFTGDAEGGFHEGNADALWRHRRLIAEFAPDVVVVLSADAVYALDYRDVVDAHLSTGADVTIVTAETDDDARRFGVVRTATDGRVVDFAYKPDDPQTNVVATEVFVYRRDALLRALEELGSAGGSLDDFGDHLLPMLIGRGRAHEFRHTGYWRDVGIPESYWRAHQELISNAGGLDLDDPRWPIRTTGARRPPARLSAGASVADSLVSPACTIEGAVGQSVLSPGVRVEEGAVVERCVVLDDAVIRKGAHVRDAIVDAGLEVRPGDEEGIERQGAVRVLAREEA